MLAFLLAGAAGLFTLAATKTTVVAGAVATGADQGFQRRNLERDDALGLSQTRTRIRRELNEKQIAQFKKIGMPVPPPGDEEEMSIFVIPERLAHRRFPAGNYILLNFEYEQLIEALVNDSATYDYEVLCAYSKTRAKDPAIAAQLAAMKQPK